MPNKFDRPAIVPALAAAPHVPAGCVGRALSTRLPPMGMCLGVIVVLFCAACSRADAPSQAAHEGPVTAPRAVPVPVVAVPHVQSPSPALVPNPQVCAATVAEAQDTGKHLERLSVQIAPPPYTKTRDLAALQRYLNVIEPGRVYQTADPATGAPQLTAVDGGATRVIPALGSTTLAVQAVPGAPCTFLATEGGSFAETRLSCATVLAAADGIARATYQADAGTIDDATILIGSPESVGTLALIVHVHYPNSFMPAPAATPTPTKP